LGSSTSAYRSDFAKIGIAQVSADSARIKQMLIKGIKGLEADLQIGSLSEQIRSLHKVEVLAVRSETAYVQRLRRVAVGEGRRLRERRRIEVTLSPGPPRSSNVRIQLLMHSRNDVGEIYVIEDWQRKVSRSSLEVSGG
jgi:hypothetical protein